MHVVSVLATSALFSTTAERFVTETEGPSHYMRVKFTGNVKMLLA